MQRQWQRRWRWIGPLGLAALALAGLVLALASGSPAPGPPNIVVISIDGLRADRTGFGGNPRPTTPNLDALAAQGVRFPNAWSQSNESLLSHAALFTGRYPAEVAWPDYLSFVLPESATTLAEALTAVGYRTAAFMAGGHVRADFGFSQGFETFFESEDFGSFFHTVPPALSWLGSQRGAQAPFFMFLHGYDCHRPYRHASVFYHPFDADYSGVMDELIDSRIATELIFNGTWYPDFDWKRVYHERGMALSDPLNYLRLADTDRGRAVPLSDADIEHMRAHYDGAVLSADTYVGLFLQGLIQAGLWDTTLVIVLSDHGEDLQTHGFSNHRAVLRDSTTRVPMILGGGALSQALRGQVRPELVQAVDLVPTVMDLAGSVPIAGGEGRSLWALLSGEPTPPVASIFQQGVLGQSALVTATHRLVFSGLRLTDPDYGRSLAEDPLTGGSFALYDRRTDPEERRDVLAEQPQLAARLRDALVSDYRGQERSDLRNRLDPALLKVLRERGYW